MNIDRRNFLKATGLTFSGALLSACATAPRYQPPAVSTPVAWQQAVPADTAGSRVPAADETRAAAVPTPSFGGPTPPAQPNAARMAAADSGAARGPKPQLLPPETPWWKARCSVRLNPEAPLLL